MSHKGLIIENNNNLKYKIKYEQFMLETRNFTSQTEYNNNNYCAVLNHQINLLVLKLSLRLFYYLLNYIKMLSLIFVTFCLVHAYTL